MSSDNCKRITVWVQHFADREYLMLQWHDPDTGKRKSKSAGTNNPLQAEQRRADLEYELNHGTYQEASRMTWERFRELFEAEYLSGRRLNTRRNYADTFAIFERLCQLTSLRAISARTLSAFVGALRQEPGKGGTVQESTIKIRFQHLRTALRWAIKQKLLPECPAFPIIKPPKRKPQPVSLESFERLLSKAADPHMRVFLLCGWLAGLRLHEACALEWEETEEAPHIDLERDRIVFPARIVKAVEDQWVPLDAELRAALLALPRHGRKVFRFIDRRSGQLRPLPRSVIVSHRISDLARSAGVRLTMKSLRRGFGCYWASRVPAQVLQKLMRHAHIATTMIYYVNVDDAAVEAIRGRTPSLRNTGRNSEEEGRQEGREADAASDCPSESCG
jgi:integrase